MDFGIVWVLILSSLLMGLAGVCIFIYAIKTDLFKNIEDTKYQVFWSDLEDPSTRPGEQGRDRKGHEQKGSGGAFRTRAKLPS